MSNKPIRCKSFDKKVLRLVEALRIQHGIGRSLKPASINSKKSLGGGLRSKKAQQNGAAVRRRAQELYAKAGGKGNTKLSWQQAQRKASAEHKGGSLEVEF